MNTGDEMKIAGKTDIGNRRLENQDRYIAGRLLNGVAFGFVCDGMGGVNGGAYAAQSLAKIVEENLFLHNEDVRFNEERAVLNAIEDANSRIYNMGISEPEYRGMGTTIAGVTIKKEECIIYHVGDSRVYIMRNRALTQLTTDHSVVQELLKQSKISPSEAESHPQKNLITRAVGVCEEVEVEVACVDILPGDIILCATDGLTNAVSSQELISILSMEDIFKIPQRLIEKALVNNSTDNITAVVIAV